MMAIVVRAHGGLDQLRYEEVPDPTPRDGQVLIRVGAVGVNQLDLFVRKGMPGLRVPMPIITGGDIAGEIADANGQPGWSAGDRVSVFPIVDTGRFAGGVTTLGELVPGGRCEYMAVDPDRLIPLPPEVSIEDAAALPTAYATALRMLNRGAVTEGERVLVVGAAGGVGAASVQLAICRGAHVIACASGDIKRRWLEELGVAHVIDYASESIRDGVRRLHGKHSVDVAVNFTGGHTWAETLGTLKLRGRQLTCGATAGFDPPTDLRLIFIYELSVIGSNGFTKQDQEAVIHMVAQGQLKPAIGHILPLSDARQAEQLLEDRKNLGKVLLIP